MVVIVLAGKRNVVEVLHSFTSHEAVLRKSCVLGRCRFNGRLMWDRRRVDRVIVMMEGKI